tara:strand:+ start:1020 stop:1787 length:768 start_codon:yes stop_codon:yes gene_type:complete
MDKNIPHTIFIIPYRKREEHKKLFDIYFSNLKTYNKWNDQNTQVYYIHQQDERPFNRGCIKNIGFLVMKEKYPKDYQNITFVFHDIDSIPISYDLIPYTTQIGTITHYYGYKFCLGGIFAIKGCDFEKTHGFPNLWGWGFEDTLIHERALQVGLKVDRSVFFEITDKKIKRPFDGYERLMSKRETTMFKMEKETMDNMNDVKNINYVFDGNMIHIKFFKTKRNYENIEFANIPVSGPNKKQLKTQRNWFRKNWNM